MLDIDTLDNVIALVVVILLLSLIVQSVQGFVKKLSRVKSKQIEDSLVELFDAVLRGRDTQPRRRTTRIPGMFPPSAIDTASSQAKNLLQAVKTELRELGRVSAFGTFTLDSLSKSDLLNVLARVGPDTLIGDFAKKLQHAMNEVAKIEVAIKRINAAALPGEANALFMKFRESLAPLRQHYNALTTGGTVNASVVVADVLTLRDIVFKDSLDLLGKVQQIALDQKLTAVAADLAQISDAINDAREALDDTFAAFRRKLVETEQWFDTTMQSFEERYHRGMRTWTIAIAIVVVFLLDANVFTIYRAIANDATRRAELVGLYDDLSKIQKEMEKEEAEQEAAATATDTTATASTAATNGAAATDTTATGTTTAAPATTTAAPVAPAAAAATPAPQKSPTLQKEYAEHRARVQQLTSMYTTVGFNPFTLQRLKGWFADLISFAPHRTNGSWIARRMHNLRTLFGWLIMALLLSLGAPFWHDALESLFGVKNLLRRRTETQNVEQNRGAGNPKP